MLWVGGRGEGEEGWQKAGLINNSEKLRCQNIPRSNPISDIKTEQMRKQGHKKTYEKYFAVETHN
jgi:hypothetical protein